MNGFKRIALSAAVAGACFAAIAPGAEAQISVNIDAGVAPACPYGYYDAAPYSCAPYGYYGPEWFNGGVFVGAGRWYHGPANFHGKVDNHFDTQHGYRGPMPNRGDRAEASKPLDRVANFRGNEDRDGHGRAGEERH